MSFSQLPPIAEVSTEAPALSVAAVSDVKLDTIVPVDIMPDDIKRIVAESLEGKQSLLSVTAVPGGITIEMCIEIARVSSTRQDKQADALKLLKFLIDHGHWSPLQHKHMTLLIVTMRGISAQLSRHRSFTFQELSQRYVDVGKIHPTICCVPEMRMQATKNRQSSTEVCSDPAVTDIVKASLEHSVGEYRRLLSMGVARECARFVLPLATITTVYMTGSVRSWIHFIQGRDHPGAQKECRDIAIAARVELIKQCPLLEGLV